MEGDRRDALFLRSRTEEGETGVVRVGWLGIAMESSAVEERHPASRLMGYGSADSELGWAVVLRATAVEVARRAAAACSATGQGEQRVIALRTGDVRGAARRASAALQNDGMMRAAGRPSFLKAKDSGHVVAGRTLAQGAFRRTTVHGRDGA